MMSALLLLTVVALGLSAGALLAEGAVLVPLWRSLSPQSFLDWYHEHGPLLLRFFGPLEVVAALLALLAAVVAWLGGSAAAPLLSIAGVLAILVVATFPVYFRRVNASFAEGTIALERVAAELRRWSCWHWSRTAVAVLAFLFAVMAALAPGIGAAA